MYTYFWHTFLQIFTTLKSWCPFTANKNIYILSHLLCVSISFQKHTRKHDSLTPRNASRRLQFSKYMSPWNVFEIKAAVHNGNRFISFTNTWTLSCVRQNNDNSNIWFSYKAQLSLHNGCFRITTSNSIQICSADILILRPTTQPFCLLNSDQFTPFCTTFYTYNYIFTTLFTILCSAMTIQRNSHFKKLFFAYLTL